MNKTHTQASTDLQIQTLRNFLAREPNDGRAWLMMAKLLSKKFPGDELQHALSQAIGLQPDNEQAWLLAAQMQQREHPDAAVAGWLAKACSDNPTLLGPRLALAAFIAPKDPAAAHSQLKQIITSRPQDPRAYVSLAEVLHKQDQQEAAIVAATDALQIDEGLLPARAVRAEAFKRTYHWSGALSDYRYMLGKQPDNARLLNKAGVCLVRLENYDAAREHFEKAQDIDPAFANAKLNLGLLDAVQLKTDPAILSIGAVVDDPGLDDASRHLAKTALQVFDEHRRLQPYLEQALQSGDVQPLQTAIRATPAKLVLPDRRCEEQLWKLAELCRTLDSEAAESPAHPGADFWLFLEACAQLKLEGDGLALAEVHSTTGEDSPINRELLRVRQLQDERIKVNADLLTGEQGEAWLKYWHFRLLNHQPEKQPGQYKAIPNTVGKRSLTPPESVSAAMRVLISEILPGLPRGICRGAFMYLAMILVHGFGDGNGRIGRFLLAWETESSGVPAVFFPTSLLGDLPAVIEAANYDHEIGPLRTILEKSQETANRQLEQLTAAVAR